MNGANEITVDVCARCSLTIDNTARPCAAAPGWPSVPCTPVIEVEVCGSCAVVLFNGDSTHLDDSENLATIEATIETMREPALGDYTSGGYVRCYVCGDDVIGSHRVTCEVAP